jgi:hypothetical protein
MSKADTILFVLEKIKGAILNLKEEKARGDRKKQNGKPNSRN